MTRYGNVLSQTMSLKSRHTVVQSRTIVDATGQFKKKKNLFLFVCSLYGSRQAQGTVFSWWCVSQVSMNAFYYPPSILQIKFQTRARGGELPFSGSSSTRLGYEGYVPEALAGRGLGLAGLL